MNSNNKKRLLWLNSAFNSGFTLIDGNIYDVFFDLPPMQLYKNSKLKVISYTRESNQAKPIVIKLKDLNFQRTSVMNSDYEYHPIIYSNHTGVEGMTFHYNPSISLIPQQIPRITLRLDDNFNSYFNGLLGTITNGELVIIPNTKSYYLIFKSSGSFVLDKSISTDIFMIGGGGGGGAGFGGGGGAGAYYLGSNVNLNAGIYTITVGDGGQGQQNIQIDNGANGGNTSITLNGTTFLTVNGGAKGAGYVSSGVGLTGKNGGCGSGAGAYYSGQPTNTAVAGGSAVNTGTNGSGYNGGTGYSTQLINGALHGGGGGGIGGNGGNAVNFGAGAVGAKGGDGLVINITGSGSVYGGGGAGGVRAEVGTISVGIGGGATLNGNFTKVGGDGGLRSDTIDRDGKHAVASTGSGGGGASGGFSKGGNGSAGIVIIRFYPIRRIEGINAENSNPPAFILGLQLEDE